jgi:hypothetical protein
LANIPTTYEKARETQSAKDHLIYLHGKLAKETEQISLSKKISADAQA